MSVSVSLLYLPGMQIACFPAALFIVFCRLSVSTIFFPQYLPRDTIIGKKNFLNTTFVF